MRDCAPDALPDSLRYAASRDLFSTELFHAGAFEIQDIASQAVSVLAAPKPGELQSVQIKRQQMNWQRNLLEI